MPAQFELKDNLHCEKQDLPSKKKYVPIVLANERAFLKALRLSLHFLGLYAIHRSHVPVGSDEFCVVYVS